MIVSIFISSCAIGFPVFKNDAIVSPAKQGMDALSAAQLGDRAFSQGQIRKSEIATLRSPLLDLCKKIFELTTGELKDHSGAASRGSS